MKRALIVSSLSNEPRQEAAVITNGLLILESLTRTLIVPAKDVLPKQVATKLELRQYVESMHRRLEGITIRSPSSLRDLRNEAVASQDYIKKWLQMNVLKSDFKLRFGRHDGDEYKQKEEEDFVILKRIFKNVKQNIASIIASDAVVMNESPSERCRQQLIESCEVSDQSRDKDSYKDKINAQKKLAELINLNTKNLKLLLKRKVINSQPNRNAKGRRNIRITNLNPVYEKCETLRKNTDNEADALYTEIRKIARLLDDVEQAQHISAPNCLANNVDISTMESCSKLITEFIYNNLIKDLKSNFPILMTTVNLIKTI